MLALVFLLPLAAAAAPAAQWAAAALAAPPAQAARAIERERARGGFDAMEPHAAALLNAAGESPAPSGVELAEQAAPDSTYLRWNQWQRALRTGTATALPAAAVALLGAAAADPWVQLTALVVGAVFLCTTAWFVAAAVVLYHGVRQGRLLRHDYSDSFPARFRRVTPLAFALFVLVVLCIAGVGPLVLLALAGALLTPYMGTRARVLLGVAVFVGCLLPTAVVQVARWSGSGADAAWLTYRVQRGDAGADLLAALQALPGPETARGRYLQARVARRNGDLGEAGRLLSRVGPELEPGLAANELGNLALLDGDLASALRHYRDAADARPGDPVPWLNQHLVHMKRLELDAADTALVRARQMGEVQVARFEAVRVADPEAVLPVAHRVPHGWVAARFAAGGSTAPGWADALRHGLFLPGEMVKPGYVGLFVLVIALVAGRAGQDKRSRHCPSCGFVVCPRCSRRIRGSLLCSACWSANHDREVDASERERREKSTLRWKTRQALGRRVGHVLLPGWGDLFGAAPLRGAVLALLWAGGAGCAVLALWLPLPVFPWGGPRLHWMVGVVPLGLAYLSGVWCAVRCRREV